MLGLPGSTRESFGNDLQQCIDREVTAKVFQTELLINSPMNEQEYRDEHQIATEQIGTGMVKNVASRRQLVVSTASFTRSDYDEMLGLREAFRLFENFGVLRQVSRYVRHEVGVTEVAFLESLRTAATDRRRWPSIATVVDIVPELMVPPISWQRFIDEVHDLVVGVHGVADDDALASVLAVQHGLLPAFGRSFPISLELPHDVESWHRAMIDAKEAGYTTTWTEVVAPLRTFDPARFLIDDPNHVCEQGIGFRIEEAFYGSWELASPVARAMPANHLEHA